MGKSVKVANVPNAPAFSAYRGTSDQSVTSATWTKVQLNAEEFDTASAFDSSTNYRFTPQVAGYYQINGQLTPTGTTISRVISAIYKNGSAYKTGNDVAVGRSNVSTVVYLNGSTDYVELWGYATVTSGAAFYNGSGVDTYMNGVLVRPA